MIVLYDDDGKRSSKIGNAFVEKGIENTYVVSGGFLGVCATCPQILVGQPPTEVELSKRMALVGLKPSNSASPSVASSRISTAGSVRTHRTGLTSSQMGSPVKPSVWR
jgi:hypothetical protein